MQAYIEYFKDGLIMPNVQFPVDFNGLRGVGVKNPISLGDRVIAIHHKYAISAFSAFSDPECLKIMMNHPEVYPSLNDIRNNQSDFQCLILYLIVNRYKLRQIFDVNDNPLCLMDCKVEIRFPYLVGVLDEFNFSYNYKKQSVLSQVPEINEQLYDWAYKYTMNRRLSVHNDYPFSFLVPVVDMINHGKNKVVFGLEKPIQKYQKQIANNKKIFDYLKARKFWLRQDDQIALFELNVNESERCRKQLKHFANIMFQEMLEGGSEEIWEFRMFDPDDEPDEEETPQIVKESKPQTVQAAVDDQYIRNYYEMADENELDWYTDMDKNEEAYLTARANDDMEPGEQVLNLYGCLGNEQLLLYYGFALLKNKYDRVRFRIFMDCNTHQEFISGLEKLIITQYVNTQDKVNQKFQDIDMNMLTTEFKLKKSELSLELINFFRTYLKLLDYEDEITVLDLYRRVLINLRLPKQEQTCYWSNQLAIYAANKQRILDSHMEMLNYINQPINKIPIKVFWRIRKYIKV